MSEYAMELRNLKKTFGDFTAVNGLSFQVKKGELFGFLGVNGAGKSTTINMLCTLFAPTEGQAFVAGYEVGKDNEEIRKHIGVVYQNNCLDELLTVRENLLLRGGLYETDRGKLEKRLEEVCEILELREVLKKRYGKLSGGQKRRAEIARALMNTPDILFLDEPTTGLDPATRKSVWETVKKLQKEEGMTVFLTTHYMEEAAMAKHIAILDAGNLVELGTPFELKEKYAKDKLRLIPKTDTKDALVAQAREEGLEPHIHAEYVNLYLNNTLEALDFLKKAEGLIEGFEVIQGTMDDVFLNVTGRTEGEK